MTDEQKDRIRLWVAALRSGEFQQGKDLLRHGDFYCCIGVGCEVYRRTTKDGAWLRSEFEASGSYSTTAFPNTVRDWYGLPSASPLANTGRHFSDMNDDDKADFPTIADAIEKTYLGEVA